MAAAAAASKGVKRPGKENAPPTLAKEVMDEGNSFDDIAEDPVKAVRPVSKAIQPTKGKVAPKSSSREADDDKATSVSRTVSGSSKRLEQLEAENKRLRSQRDEYSRQFEELSNLRNTAIEKTLEKFKENMDTQGKAKDDIITSLTGLNEKLQAKVRALEKAARADAPKADPKEIKALKELVEKANGDLDKRNTEYAELEKMYKTEQQYCQTLQASRTAAPPAAADPTISNEGSAEDAAIIRLYEDITELNVVGVKSKEGKYGPKDKVMDYNCVLALTNGASINFRLRTFKELDPVKHAARARNPYDSIVQFTPELSRETDQAFIARLGRFTEEIRTTQEGLPGLMRQLRRKVAGGEE